MSNPTRLRAVRLLVLLVLFRTPPGLTGQTRDSANVTGVVHGGKSAPITEAEVSLTNTDTGLQRRTHTDSDGNFAFAGVALTGKYTLRVNKSGFAGFTREGIELRAGITAGFDVTLDVGSAHSSVFVYGAAASVQADSARTEMPLDLQKIDETPVIGRKLTSLPLLNAAVRTARGTGDLFLNNTLYVINGSGRRQTTYSIDNSTGDDSWGRQTLFTTIPFSSVQEFTVLTNTLSAEYGRTTGGAVNLVTKSGTNEFHGDLLGLFRPGPTEARMPLSISRTEDVLEQVSGAVGGPVVQDRTHFLISGEYNHQDRDSVITATVAPGVFTGNLRQTLMLGRLDHQLNSHNALMFRANFDRFHDTNPQDAVGNTSLPSTARVFRRRTYATQLSETATLTSALINQFRFQHQLGSPITQFDPVTPSTQTVFPGQYTSGESRSASLLNHQFEWADTLSYLRGRHNLKLGTDVIYSSSGGFGQEFGGGFVLGQFRVKPGTKAKPPNQLTLADMASFTQSFGNARYNIRETLWALFAQDNLRLRHDLSVDLGLRYERQTFTDETKGFSPRVGLAYLLPFRRPTVVRASYGIFFSEIRANYAAADQLNGPLGVFTFSATPGQLGFPTSLASLPAFPQGAVLPARDITVRPGQRAFLNQFFDVSKLRFYPDALLNPYTQQWNLGVEREWVPGWILSVDYVGQHTIRIERPRDLNAPDPFIRTAQGQSRAVPTANLTRPILPMTNGYRRIVANANAGAASYHGLQAKLTKRFSKHFSMLASYSWSHTIGTVEPDVPQQDPNDSNFLGVAEKATSLLDQRHRFVLSGWYEFPWQITVGGVTSLASGRLFNVTTGSDNNGDGSASDRPVINGAVVSRNFGQGTPLYDVSIFLAKEARLGDRLSLNLRGEAFNIFNHPNFVGRDGIYGDGATPLPTFGQALGGISNVEPARQFQFLIRLRF